jgi:hypothetical protein
MPSQRVKGQETQILYTRGGVLEDTLSNTQDFEFELKLELIEQGYLGEKSNRHDEIFNGVKFTGTLHVHTQDWINYVGAIVARAKRQTPDVIFNITSVWNLPNGQTPAVLIPDAHFGPVPHGMRTRKDYVTVKIEGAADDFLPQLT